MRYTKIENKEQAEADGFRRAMTHDRTEEEMEKMRDAFIASATKNGVSRKIAEKVFEQLAAFAAYGFCKAHAVAYATLAYQTLWLKCHYPAEFFAAVLSNQPMGYYPPRVLVADAKRFGVKVLPPDINRSSNCYTVEDNAIRVSLTQLKGMSEEALESILSTRAKSEFNSLRNFVLRTDVNQTILENLKDVSHLPRFSCAQTKIGEFSVFVARTGYTGEDGFEVISDAASALPLWESFMEQGVKPCGLGARDSLRLEAGMTLYGQDMDTSTNPFKAGLGWLIDLDDGDFVGKSALLEIKRQGVRRKLVGFKMEGREIARSGYLIFKSDQDGSDIRKDWCSHA